LVNANRSSFRFPKCGLSIGINKESKNMANGKVKWFNSQKGYGFIEPEDGTQDVFVHITAVQNSGMDGLNEGQSLSYELETGQNGKTSAVDLKAL
jgi:CspA family cold shock protein